MTHSDITIPLSRLIMEGDDRASIRDDGLMLTHIAGLLDYVVKHNAAILAADMPVNLVSMTLDVTGEPPATGQIDFTSTTDRKTRTLIFIGGHAVHAGGSIIKLTAVYRIG